MITRQWMNDAKIETIKVLIVAQEFDLLKNKNIQKQIAVIRTPTFWEYKTTMSTFRHINAIGEEQQEMGQDQINCTSQYQKEKTKQGV